MPYADKGEFQKRRKTRRAYRRMVIARWKRKKGCSICGYNENANALQLDHLYPEQKSKAFRRSPNMALCYDWSWVRIKEEMGKCQVLCGNCHLIKSARDNNYYLTLKGRPDYDPARK
jgi:hypothetical protein